MNSNNINVIRLKCRLQFEEPLPKWERFPDRPNYPTILGYLDIYIEERKIGTGLISSTYILWLLIDLLGSFPKIISGETIIVRSLSDPWSYRFVSFPKTKQMTISIYGPKNTIALHNIKVSHLNFFEEVIRVSQEWLIILKQYYPDEVNHPQKDKEYQRLIKYINGAKKLLNNF